MTPGTTVQRRVRTALTIVAIAATVILILLVAWTVHGRRMATTEGQVRLEALTASTVQRLSSTLTRIADLARDLSARINERELDEREMTALFRKTLELDPSILEVGVAYQPGVRGPRLFAPHYGYRDGAAQSFRVEDFYDYTERDWFREGIASGPLWGHPYFGEATRSWVVGYTVPIRRPGQDGPPVGVVRINYSMSGIRMLLGSLQLGNEGYAAVTTRNGKFVYHPIEDFVRSQITIGQLGTDRKDRELVELARRVTSGQTGMMERRAVLTGEASWSFYRPIPKTDWTLILLFMRDELTGDATTIRREGIAMALSLAVALLAWALVFLRIEQGSPRRLWIAAWVTSILFSACIVEIWILSFDKRQYNVLMANTIHDHTDLMRFASARRDRARHRGEPDPVFLPTGAFVQSLEFVSPTDVEVNGTIWQKYAIGTQDAVPRGFSLPDATEQTVSEIYRARDDSGREETVGWRFRARLRQQFAFGRYPLDYQNVRLRIARRDFNSSAILLPDIAAYESLIPQTLPGIERSFVTAGWLVEKTFFSHVLSGFNTDFGIERFVGKEGYPDLVFNVIVRRDFLSPFIANIVPLILIAGIAFALLCMIGSDQSRIAAFDARGGRTTGTSAALFFAVLLSHIRLRNELVGLREMIYVECFYFIGYVALLGLVADVFAVGTKVPLGIVRFGDNLLPKVIFWPFVTFASLVITVWFFY